MCVAQAENVLTDLISYAAFYLEGEGGREGEKEGRIREHFTETYQCNNLKMKQA